MSTITLDDMRSRLLTISDVEARLGTTEPLSTQHLTSDTKNKFRLLPNWNENLDEVDPDDPVDVFLSVNDQEHPLSKEAALQAGAVFGLTSAYVRKTPAALIEAHLNYWYSGGMGSQEFNALAVGDTIRAFTRPSVVPFSNLNLLESVVDGIHSQYGSDTEILADYKFHNSLTRTDMRLIIPERERTISGGGLADVPANQADLWSAGIHVTNSLIGKTQTAVDAYLFRWWCTNGATTTMDNVGTWSRRSDGQGEDVYVWAEQAVDEVLGGMESAFDRVQALTALNVAGNTSDVLKQIYTDFEIPVAQREQIAATLLESETLSMYSVMNAITQTANDPGLSPSRVDRMMRIGGAVPTTTFDTIKAKVWAEGHTASPDSPNPYRIG